MDEYELFSETVAELTEAEKRIAALEQLCKDQRYCIAKKGNCRFCPLWERDKEKQCQVLNPDRMEELGLADRVFSHITTLEKLCRDMWKSWEHGNDDMAGFRKMDEIYLKEYRDRMDALGLLEGGEND